MLLVSGVAPFDAPQSQQIFRVAMANIEPPNMFKPLLSPNMSKHFFYGFLVPHLVRAIVTVEIESLSQCFPITTEAHDIESERGNLGMVT